MPMSENYQPLPVTESDSSVTFLAHLTFPRKARCYWVRTDSRRAPQILWAAHRAERDGHVVADTGQLF